MDRELVALVGAGMQVIANGIVGRPPDGSLRNGFAFVDHLLMFGNSGLDGVVVDTVTTLWRDWLKSGLPREVAEDHIAILPELLERYRVEPAAVRAAFAVTVASRQSGNIGADRLTASIIAAASKDGCFDGTGFNRQLAFFFIERLLSLMLEQRSLVEDLHVAIQNYFAHFVVAPIADGTDEASDAPGDGAATAPKIEAAA